MPASGRLSSTVWEWPATGTTWRIHHSGGVDSLVAGAVAGLVERDEERWSRFRPGSEVTRLTAGAGRWVRVSAETSALLELAVAWCERTDGLFQPLVGRALAGWGYASSLTSTRPHAATSPEGRPVEGSLELNPARGRARVPAGARLDLGGIAKSYMALRAGRMAAAMCDEPSLLIDAGGDLVAARGDHMVAVERPGPAQPNRPGAPLERPVAHVILQQGHGVATSGYGRRRWRNGDDVEAHHLIDPATGCPGPRAHATVLAPDPVGADVTAKCLALRPDLIDGLDLPAMVTVGEVMCCTAAWAEVQA
jgi:thiamine biosynthesis lipoprotein